VDLLDAAVAKMSDAFRAGRPPDDRILHDHNLFPLDQRLYRIELDANAEIPHRLAWLDEGPPHIVFRIIPISKGIRLSSA